MNSIDGAARFLIECGAGLGLVLILRWYWWRINAWSEITASVAPFVGYFLANFLLELPDPLNFLFTVGFSTISWLLVTFLTKSTNEKHLLEFYEKVQPDGWWKPFERYKKFKSNLKPLFYCWLSSIGVVYSFLFFIGDIIFLNFEKALIEMGLGLFFYFFLRFQLKKTRIFDI